MALALPVYHPDNQRQVMLRAGYELEADLIERMLEMGIGSVWVDYPSMKSVEQFISKENLQAQSELIDNVSDAMEAMQQKSTAKLDYSTYTDTVNQLADALFNNPDSAIFLGDLSASDSGMLRHATNVAYLSALLGLKLGVYIARSRKHGHPDRTADVVTLGLGAMLHDIGITQVDETVREHYHATGDDTDPAWRDHTLHGYQMVRGNISPTAAIIALQHHLRLDGNGYLDGSATHFDPHKMHVFPRIVAVADTFDHLRHPTDSAERPTVQALSEMVSPELLPGFDAHAVRALIAVTPPYSPGTIVGLSDGREAAVVDHHPLEPCRPLVQPLHPDDDPNGEPSQPTIDLRKCDDDLYVAEADEQSVSEFNFELPETLVHAYIAA